MPYVGTTKHFSSFHCSCRLYLTLINVIGMPENASKTSETAFLLQRAKYWPCLHGLHKILSPRWRQVVSAHKERSSAKSFDGAVSKRDEIKLCKKRTTRSLAKARRSHFYKPPWPLNFLCFNPRAETESYRRSEIKVKANDAVKWRGYSEAARLRGRRSRSSFPSQLGAGNPEKMRGAKCVLVLIVIWLLTLSAFWMWHNQRLYQ